MSDRSLRDEDLVRVRSHSELQAGMTVVVKNCVEAHGKTVAMVLVSHVVRSCCHGGQRSGFMVAPDVGDPGWWCFCGALRDGALYRLRSSDGKEREEGAGLARKAQLYQSALKLRREGAL